MANAPPLPISKIKFHTFTTYIIRNLSAFCNQNVLPDHTARDPILFFSESKENAKKPRICRGIQPLFLDNRWAPLYNIYIVLSLAVLAEHCGFSGANPIFIQAIRFRKGELLFLLGK